MKKTPIFLSILLTLALSLGLFFVPTAPVAAEGMEGPINIYTRDSASGTREGFEGVIEFKGELADTANEVTSNGDMAAKVGQDPNGIGYVSLSPVLLGKNSRLTTPSLTKTTPLWKSPL